MEPRDLAGVLLRRDFEAELVAARILLFRNRKADKGLRDELKSLEELSEFPNERAVSRWLDLLQVTTYLDAAHSMAAVGMLAPLLESMFDGAFNCAREEFFLPNTMYTGHPRWEWAAEDQWDCHFVYDGAGKRRKSLVEGIFQLAEAVGLAPYLPTDLKPTFQALFEYRNRMLHLGFEWPSEERDRFARRIKDACWPSNWFAAATTDGTSWIFYLTDVFVDHCLNRIDRSIEGMGAFVAARLRMQRDRNS